MERKLKRDRSRLEQLKLKLKLKDPAYQLNEKRQRLADLEECMERAIDGKLRDRRYRLGLLAGKLEALSPLEKISKGFGFLTDEKGKRITSIRQAEPGKQMEIQIRDGRIRAGIM